MQKGGGRRNLQTVNVLMIVKLLIESDYVVINYEYLSIKGYRLPLLT